jgi:ABC-type nitrate/sulfonate/bicarbonate transport system ATPase subunit/ABC-type nitrate/sulfonate/bicarbonate transport system permease component
VRRLINQHPGRGARIALGVLPFAALLLVYVVASRLRLAENPNDKLLPSLGTIADTFHNYAFEADKRSGHVLFWVDTWASVRRIGIALLISASSALALAIAIGVVPRLRAALSPLLSTVAMIPPLAVLPILFIVLGLEETSKVALIVIGTAPCIARDLALRVGELSKEQLIKAQTLGASTWHIVLRVVLPQMWPRLIDSLRLSMGSTWLFLIAAEAIAATEGLGYRIFLVRRYLAMDVILPYVLWITLLAVGTDALLRLLRSRAFRWAEPGQKVATVSVRNVWKEYGAQVVLENVRLEIADHEFVTIVGASGCGKTTFLKMLLGMEQPSRGQILIDGIPIRPEPDPARGVVFQRYSSFPHLTVLENVMLGLELQRSKFMGRLFGGARRAARDTALEMLNSVGLSAARDRYPAQLSGGMQQRMSIAQAVICKPKILLLDEPFGALDPGVTADMHELILKLWADNRMTIFMVSHDIKESFTLGTRLLTFDKLRHDPQAPEAYGANVTYDMPLTRRPSGAREMGTFLVS